MNNLIKHLDRILNNSTLNENIILATAKLISSIGRLFTNEIVNSETLTNEYLHTAFKGLSNTRYNEVKIDLLNFHQFVLRNVKTKVDFEGLSQVFL